MNYHTLRINLRLFLETQFPGWIRPREFGIVDTIINQEVNSVFLKNVEIFLLYGFFEENAVVIDVGANRGLYTYLLTHYGNNYKVIAFEPIPELARRLKKLFNSKVIIYPYAISGGRAFRGLKIPYINNTIFRTRATLETSLCEVNENKSKIVNVQCVNFDDFVQQNNINNIQFIKIDVEGHEFEVLKGAEKTLLHEKPVLLIEIEKRHHQSLPIQDVFSWLQMRNYDGLFVDKEEWEVKTLTEFEPDKHQNTNKTNAEYYIKDFIFCNIEMKNRLKSYIVKQIEAVLNIRH